MMSIIVTILYLISARNTAISIMATAEASLGKAMAQQMFVMLVSSFLYAYILYLL